MIKNLKGVVVGLTVALLLTACSTDQEKVNVAKKVKSTNSIATNATKSEIASKIAYESRVKKMKKKKNKFISKAKIDLKKFCFKNSRSIHYRAKERCK